MSERRFAVRWRALLAIDPTKSPLHPTPLTPDPPSASFPSQRIGSGSERAATAPEEADSAACSASTSTVPWSNALTVAPVGGSVLRSGAMETRFESESNFATVWAPSLGVPSQSGCWYYEVQLITDGVMQIGWASAAFTPNDEEGDGVGDGVGSWAFDGVRQRCWSGAAAGAAAGTTSGDEAETLMYGKRWESGDIVGCTLNSSAGTIAFSLNGESLGVAFSEIYAGVSTAADCVRFPAFSLESGEVVVVNLGGGSRGSPFAFGADVAFRSVAEATALSKSAFGALPPPPRVAPVVAAMSSSSSSSSSSAPTSANVRARLVEASSRPTTAAMAAPSASAPGAAAAPTATCTDIDLAQYANAEDLCALPAEQLKHALQARGLKCGGAPRDRALRLFAVKGLDSSESRRTSFVLFLSSHPSMFSSHSIR